MKIQRIVAAVALTACATATPALRRGWEPQRGAVLVPVAASKAEAFQRTLAAFAAEGLTVENASAEAGFITSVPKTEVSLLQNLSCRYRATVTATASGSEVSLALGLRELTVRMQETRDAETPGSPANIEAWRRLQRIADRLRAP